MRRHLERFRMAGHDVEIDGPRFVPLGMELFICVQDGYFRSDVQTALLQVTATPHSLMDGVAFFIPITSPLASPYT